MTTYAIIPAEQWVDELVGRFPHAPLVQNYRVLVFADKETEQLKADYEHYGPVDANKSVSIIKLMSYDTKHWLICKVEPLREVMNHFAPPEQPTQE